MLGDGWCNVGLWLVQCWVMVGIMLGYGWCDVGLWLEQCWVMVGAMLVYSWLNVGVCGLWLANGWHIVG